MNFEQIVGQFGLYLSTYIIAVISGFVPREPFKGIKDLFLFPIFGTIDYL